MAAAKPSPGIGAPFWKPISRNPIRPHYSLVTRLEMTEEGTNVEMNMDNEPERKVSKRGRRGEGRPTKRTPEVVAKIAKAVAIGLTDREAFSPGSAMTR